MEILLDSIQIRSVVVYYCTYKLITRRLPIPKKLAVLDWDIPTKHQNKIILFSAYLVLYTWQGRLEISTLSKLVLRYCLYWIRYHDLSDLWHPCRAERSLYITVLRMSF